MTNPVRINESVTAVTGQVTPAAPTTGEARESRLLQAVAYDRDEAAFEQLYHEHVRAVTAAALHICRNTAVAEDIVQRTFMTLWERALRLATRSFGLRPWLVTVARNAAIDYARAEIRSVAFFDQTQSDATGVVSAQDAAVANVMAAELTTLLGALAPEQREVLERHYFDGQTFAAIAAQTGEALGTVKSRARLAIEHLRRNLEA